MVEQNHNPKKTFLDALLTVPSIYNYVISKNSKYVAYTWKNGHPNLDVFLVHACMQTKISKIDALKEIIRAWGMNPEEILTREAFSQPHRTIATEDHQKDQMKALSSALKELMKKELLNSQQTTKLV